MKPQPEVYLVCTGALAIGVVLGSMVSASPTKPPAAAAQIVAQLEASPPLSRDLPTLSQIQPTPIAAQAVPAPATADPAPTTPKVLQKAEVLALAGRCAPSEPSSVLASIARVESGNHPLKIGVNGARRRTFEPTSREAAAALTSRLMASGENIDLGLAQINSRNLGWLGLSVEDAFDPCRNLAAAAAVMARGYKAALKVSAPGRSLLQTAYSLYNTGDPGRGFNNGYVGRIEARGDQ